MQPGNLLLNRSGITSRESLFGDTATTVSHKTRADSTTTIDAPTPSETFTAPVETNTAEESHRSLGTGAIAGVVAACTAVVAITSTIIILRLLRRYRVGRVRMIDGGELYSCLLIRLISLLVLGY